MTEPDAAIEALAQALDRIAVLEKTVATMGTTVRALEEAIGNSGEFARIVIGGVFVKFTPQAHQAFEKLNDLEKSWVRFRLISNPPLFVSSSDIKTLAIPDPKPEPKFA